MDSPRQQAARSCGWCVGGIVRERLISKAPARANERYHYKQQSQRRRVRIERFRTSFFIYEFICDAGDFKLTREIIVIAGEKGKCYQGLSNKERGDGFENDLQYLAYEDVEDLGRLVDAHAAQEGAHA